MSGRRTLRKKPSMETLQYYVPPTSGVPTPAKDEIIKAGILCRAGKPIVLDVLAAPIGAWAKRSRWSLPAGQLMFSTKGVAFVTSGKRIGSVEQYLGGKLFGIFTRVGSKFLEPLAGGIIGEQLTSTVVGLHEWNERVESMSKISEGYEHAEAFVLPINRVVSMCLAFEPGNTYGVRHLEVALAKPDETFASFAILSREEDGGKYFGEAISFTYFLRLNYEQRFFQESLFRRYAGPSLEIPQTSAAWSLATLSFEQGFYERASDSMKAGSPSVDGVRLEALKHSRNVLARLCTYADTTYNLETPSGKLFDLVKAFADV